MKCETCGNEMVWKGSFLTGDLVCEYCEDDDDLCAEIHMQNGSTIKVPHNGQVIIEVFGGGGGGGIGGADPVQPGASGGSGGMTSEQIQRVLQEGFEAAQRREQERRGMPKEMVPPPFDGCGNPDCDVCSPPKLETIKCTEERLPDGRIIRTPIYEDLHVKPYPRCAVAEAYFAQKRKEREQEQQAAMCAEAERQYRLKMEGEWDI